MDCNAGDFEHFEVREPATQTIPFVFNSPHSGSFYPPEFLAESGLDSLAIRRSADHYVDELFADAPELGAPLLLAHFPRAYLDVNREPYELDPRMFDGPLPPFVNIGSMRVAGGLGTIPRIVAENMEIYRRRLPVNEAMSRIETIYKPYHACLRKLIARTHARFGLAILIDCHSMPGNIRLSGSDVRPDFIIGDRYGTSASAELSRAAMQFLEGMGFSAVRNKPYAGGFITEHYGRPVRGLHALQIEINRALYVDEMTLARRPEFPVIAATLSTFMRQMADFVIDFAGGDSALAAE
ncbi:N-formylglutamate amidohydrolase [Neorhizobium galegae]|uniref:N-formylglutamate amidohydrolase n=1 Tax=Neorhizobium galegae TaxID=399 RepID=UPI0006216F88|nr:N-formylglutamate amidohydrolase [Neorhizobium galegae]CDZ56579.1 N-formylglutamate amidohydrolase [Neorhizobium galegae bv. orientalis]KAB1124168.1 N-formylglutamate amidohydrolase [Neorhizobium galegae]MCQ1571062.1 N-formylglutamate amidohydrolase [Neorhizobium galegae]MCQ1809732.1 N-formylglutamate amidohydrolase [Neorhizobium galegae]CDZ59146.1 N-formylglutamate amidohydrolase [Neorhizobium galegae bv. orientalis]